MKKKELKKDLKMEQRRTGELETRVEELEDKLRVLEKRLDGSKNATASLQTEVSLYGREG